MKAIKNEATEGLKEATGELKIEKKEDANCQAVWFLGEALKLIKEIEAIFKKDDYKPEDVTKAIEAFKKETRKGKKPTMHAGINSDGTAFEGEVKNQDLIAETEKAADKLIGKANESKTKFEAESKYAEVKKANDELEKLKKDGKSDKDGKEKGDK